MQSNREIFYGFKFQGQLASIPNEEANDFMKIIAPSERTLIGGFATGPVPNPDLWTWTDGTPWSYMDWAPGEPNNFAVDEFCLEMKAQIGEWNDFPCIESFDRNYICQKYPTCK